MLSPEDLSTMQLLRSRILGQEQIDPKELANAIRLLRADRLNAATRAKVSKSKAPARPKITDKAAVEILGKLGIPGL